MPASQDVWKVTGSGGLAPFALREEPISCLQGTRKKQTQVSDFTQIIAGNSKKCAIGAFMGRSAPIWERTPSGRIAKGKRIVPFRDPPSGYGSLTFAGRMPKAVKAACLLRTPGMLRTIRKNSGTLKGFSASSPCLRICFCTVICMN